jgi:hypothetical protein
VLVDDPNLHATRYGFLRYRDVVDLDVAVHLAIAMIPLDAWYASPRARALFAAHPERLSIAYHGNDHVSRELARHEPSAAVRARLAQARRRIATFERRYGLAVDAVMVPPHGGCAETTTIELRRAGFDALCISRPHPVRPWVEQPGAEEQLGGMAVGLALGGGLLTLPRVHIQSPPAHLLMRAFLGQPLVLYGHHWDLPDAGDSLVRVADEINRLGDVEWMSLGRIAETSYAHRRSGARLDLCLYGRRAVVRVPDDVRTLVVRLGFDAGGDDVSIRVGDRPLGSPDESIAVEPGAVVEVELVFADAASPGRAARPAAWPRLRRLATEARDRIRPRLP